MWLLIQSIHDQIQAARSTSASFSPDKIQAYVDKMEAAGTGGVMAVAGDSAEIHVRGVLTAAPDFYAEYFGGGNTTYPAIIAALAEADADPAIEEIFMLFDSPGGEVNGMFEAMTAIKNTKKKVTAVVSSMAASAAYGLASQAGTIVARNRASMVGSVGTTTSSYIDEHVVTLTSTNAPDKRPDVETEAGKAVVVELLDAMAGLLDEGIAEGRGTTVEKINADFGHGTMYLADKALERGMIDSIRATSANTNTVASGGQQKEQKAMLTLAELKAKHPETFAAAAKETLDAERDRVNAHLTMGTSSGDMKTAIAAVNDGSAMTSTLQATYMSAGMNRADIEARTKDDADAAGADGTQDVSADAEAAANKRLAAATAEACGVEINV